MGLGQGKAAVQFQMKIHDSFRSGNAGAQMVIPFDSRRFHDDMADFRFFVITERRIGQIVITAAAHLVSDAENPQSDKAGDERIQDSPARDFHEKDTGHDGS